MAKDTIERYGAQWPLMAVHDIDYNELQNGPMIPANSIVLMSHMEILSATDGTSTTVGLDLFDPDGVVSDISLGGSDGLDAKTVNGVKNAVESAARTTVPMRVEAVVSEAVTQGKFRIGVTYITVGRTNEVNE